jgi:hypothetical protein
MSLASAVAQSATVGRGVTTTRGPLQNEPERNTTDDEILASFIQRKNHLMADARIVRKL